MIAYTILVLMFLVAVTVFSIINPQNRLEEPDESRNAAFIFLLIFTPICGRVLGWW